MPGTAEVAEFAAEGQLDQLGPFVFAAYLTATDSGIHACQFLLETAPPTCSRPAVLLPADLAPLVTGAEFMTSWKAGYAVSDFPVTVTVDGPLRFDTVSHEIMADHAQLDLEPNHDDAIHIALIKGHGPTAANTDDEQAVRDTVQGLGLRISPSGSLYITPNGNGFRVESMLPLNTRTRATILDSLAGNIQLRVWAANQIVSSSSDVDTTSPGDASTAESDPQGCVPWV